VAVPELVNCAEDKILVSMQYFADPSQKFTCPVVNVVVPTVAVAVSVTTVPDDTVVAD
jgi:hypothetical protein